jgi:hypothetical protein
MLVANEKNWEEQISKLNPKDKDYQKSLEVFQKIKEEQKNIIEKMNNSFLAELEIKKNKESFHR